MTSHAARQGSASIVYPTAGPGSATALEHDHWSRLPAAPISGRTDQATVWTGHQMLIWGGGSGTQGTQLHADGAGYDPVSKRWSLLPPGPLSARRDAAAVWTGNAMFVWGGYDDARRGSFHAVNEGALYNPTTRQWRMLPPSPLSARVDATALWTGRDVVVIGGQPAVTTPGGAYSDAAAYDLATNTWRRLPDPPVRYRHAVQQVVALTAGSDIYAWLPWDHVIQHKHSGSEHVGMNVDRFDTSTDRWSAVNANGDVPAGVNSPVWTGKEIIMLAAQLCPSSCPGPLPGAYGWRYDRRTDAWSAIAHGHGDAIDAQAVWTGAVLLAFNNDSYVSGDGGTIYPGDMEMWAPNRNRWTTLPMAPYAGESESISAVWAGDRLLLWGRMSPGGGANQPQLAPTRTIGLSFGN